MHSEKKLTSDGRFMSRGNRAGKSTMARAWWLQQQENVDPRKFLELELRGYADALANLQSYVGDGMPEDMRNRAKESIEYNRSRVEMLQHILEMFDLGVATKERGTTCCFGAKK
jgi:hypothetical protein